MNSADLGGGDFDRAGHAGSFVGGEGDRSCVLRFLGSMWLLHVELRDILQFHSIGCKRRWEALEAQKLKGIGSCCFWTVLKCWDLEMSDWWQRQQKVSSPNL